MIYKVKNIHVLFIMIITTIQYYYLIFITMPLKRCSELAKIKKYLIQRRNFKNNVVTNHYNEKMYLDKYFSYKYTQCEQELYNFP